MGFVTPEQIAQAKEIDLLTYLRSCDPYELVHVGGSLGGPAVSSTSAASRRRTEHIHTKSKIRTGITAGRTYFTGGPPPWTRGGGRQAQREKSLPVLLHEISLNRRYRACRFQ